MLRNVDFRIMKHHQKFVKRGGMWSNWAFMCFRKKIIRLLEWKIYRGLYHVDTQSYKMKIILLFQHQGLDIMLPVWSALISSAEQF